MDEPLVKVAEPFVKVDERLDGLNEPLVKVIEPLIDFDENLVKVFGGLNGLDGELAGFLELH